MRARESKRTVKKYFAVIFVVLHVQMVLHRCNIDGFHAWPDIW